MFRIFSLLNPKQPVAVVCEICGKPIHVVRRRNEIGEQWIGGEDLINKWLDHQLTDCIPEEEEAREVNDEDSLGG